jgi:hypothetical protein
MGFLKKKKHVLKNPNLGEKIMFTRDFKINICIFRKHEF